MNIEVANRLVELRKRNNLSQEALAEKLGISRQAVSKWERAEASPDTDNLILLARLYHISLDDLLMTGNAIPGGNSNKELGQVEQRVAEPITQRQAEPITQGQSEPITQRQAEPITQGQSEPVTQSEAEPITQGQSEPIAQRQSELVSNIGTVRIGNIEGARGSGTGAVRTSGSEAVRIGTQEEPKPVAQRERESVVIIEEEGPRFDYGVLRYFPVYMVYMVVVIAFMILGAIWNAWHPGWMLFFIPPIWQTAVMALEKRDARLFAYPVLVVLLYLCLGFFGSLWHPGWIVFLTIPLYYPLVSYFRKLYKLQKKELDDILQETKKR